MNINAIFNTTRPVSLYEKEKDTRDTSFMDVLAQTAMEASEQISERYANADEVNDILNAGFRTIKNVIWEPKFTSDPSYELTDEEIEYFREKYGEEYDEEKVREFFFELAEKGAISADDASVTSDRMYIYRIEPVGYLPPGEDMLEWASLGRIQLKCTALYATRRHYEREYNNFRYDRENDVTTWEDYMQEQFEFNEYLKTVEVFYAADGTPHPNNIDFEKRQATLERVAGVINQIFGK